MKRIFYLNLADSSDTSLGNLKEKLQELAKDKTIGYFLSMELTKRRDDVLFNDKLTADYKEGALQQITEIIDMLFGMGVHEIQKCLTKKIKQTPDMAKNNIDFKNKVLKTE